MRRWFAVAVVGAVLALSACTSLPHGVDGNLVNGWQLANDPQARTPVVGDCYDDFAQNLLEAAKVDCAAGHYIEVTYVGQFTGGASSSVSPPADASPAMSAAYAQCAAPTSTYLGGDWHASMLSLSMTVPDTSAWAGGQRWFRCDVLHMESPDGGSILAHDSVEGVLAKPGPLTLTCVTWQDHKTYINNVQAGTCGRPFEGEYAGFTVLGAQPFPKSFKAWEKPLSAKCESVVAHYLGLSTTYDTNQTVGWVWLWPSEDQWNVGDRSVRCFAASYTKSGKFTARVRGIKNRPAKG
jgi:hypothetical protein